MRREHVTGRRDADSPPSLPDRPNGSRAAPTGTGTEPPGQRGAGVTDSFVVGGGDHVVEMTACDEGLLIQQERCVRTNDQVTRSVVSIGIGSTHELARWLEGQRLRFDDPLTCSRIRRRGEEMLHERP